ncbi:MAG TPA: hypothetical protein VK818_11515 [Methylomirabilota bacterium]|jgi:hypothetical protein|nr:hypothetical protein [Methylomirabilota bacterium]
MSTKQSDTGRCEKQKCVRFFELVRFDRLPSVIANANDNAVGAAVETCVADCIAGDIRFAVRQATEWQRIGNQIDAAMIFAGPDFVNVHYFPATQESHRRPRRTKVT